MFRKLGMKIDNLLEDLKEWNRSTPWYTFYVYSFLIKEINKRSLSAGELQRIYRGGHIYHWQYMRLIDKAIERLRKG